MFQAGYTVIALWKEHNSKSNGQDEYFNPDVLLPKFSSNTCVSTLQSISVHQQSGNCSNPLNNPNWAPP
jgi:hypothetical protein